MNLLTVMEIIGTVAFSVSGALIAISCSLDIFGVVFIGIITAVGGGMLRDVLLGSCPPAIFSNTLIFTIALVTAVIVFVIAYLNRTQFAALKEKMEKMNNIFDAIGLSAFTVTGTEIAFTSGFGNQILFCVLMGMVTGICGGIFRDILTSRIPDVLKKHIYALASIAGSIVYYALRNGTENKIAAMAAGMLCVFIIRILAI